MGQSMFSYNITRPYPFQWFTTAVIVGGIISTAVLTVVTVATNGYELTTNYTSNPQATINTRAWFQKPPWSWDNTLDNKCGTQNLAVGSTFFTTNSGLSYSIQHEYQNQLDNGIKDLSASIPYLNGPLQDCMVESIRIKMNRHDPCTGSDCLWLTWGETTATATASCSIPAALLNGAKLNPTTPYKINFTTVYSSEPNDFDAFVQLDSSAQGSLWWGAQLLSMWFQALRTQMAKAKSPPNGEYDWLDVTLWFDTRKAITDMDFITFLGSYSASGTFHWLDGEKRLPLSVWNNTKVQPYLPQQIDGFVKAFYSTIMVDLGQQNAANVLTNPEHLQYYLAASFDVDSDTDTAGKYNMTALWHTDPVLASQSYEALNTSTSGMGPLGATTAQIFAQYACQVPKLKSAGSLIWSIAIGDLVLLQALWRVFVLGADWWLKRKDEGAMACEGCLRRKGMEER